MLGGPLGPLLPDTAIGSTPPGDATSALLPRGLAVVMVGRWSGDSRPLRSWAEGLPPLRRAISRAPALCLPWLPTPTATLPASSSSSRSAWPTLAGPAVWSTWEPASSSSYPGVPAAEFQPVRSPAAPPPLPPVAAVAGSSSSSPSSSYSSMPAPAATPASAPMDVIASSASISAAVPTATDSTLNGVLRRSCGDRL